VWCIKSVSKRIYIRVYLFIQSFTKKVNCFLCFIDYIWNYLLISWYQRHSQKCTCTCLHPSPPCVRIPSGTLDSFMWGSYPASLRNVGGSTRVPVHAWNNARKGVWGLPPQVKLERRHMTSTMSVWRKTQLNKQTSVSRACKNYTCWIVFSSNKWYSC
jgi:hypothetical protein